MALIQQQQLLMLIHGFWLWYYKSFSGCVQNQGTNSKEICKIKIVCYVCLNSFHHSKIHSIKYSLKGVQINVIPKKTHINLLFPSIILKPLLFPGMSLIVEQCGYLHDFCKCFGPHTLLKYNMCCSVYRCAKYNVMISHCLHPYCL